MFRNFGELNGDVYFSTDLASVAPTTTREEQRNKLEQMASLEKRSVSNLIEVMADERWEQLVEQQGVTYAKTIAGAMNLKLDMDNPADRGKLRRAILDLVAGRKMPKQKGRG